jgi:PST family polysaccharide transporter
MSRLLDKFPMLHSVVSNVSWRMAERLIAVAFSTGTGAWVARYLGPEEFGVLGAALSISMRD